MEARDRRTVAPSSSPVAQPCHSVRLSGRSALRRRAGTARAAIRWPRPLAGLQGVTLADVPREVTAGILAALMIPLNIGYAQVAGLPPVAGWRHTS
jgi:hypothetical protein